MNNTKNQSIPLSKALNKKEKSSQGMVVSSVKSSLMSHLKLAARSGFLKDCSKLQDTVRTSVESLGKILNATGASWRTSSNLAHSAVHVECDIKSLKQNKLKVRNDEQRVRSYSSNTILASTRASKPKNGIKKKNFKELLLAVYKGWKVRNILKKEGLQEVQKELKTLHSKLRSAKSLNKSGVSIIKTTYQFKLKQFHVLLNSKLNPVQKTIKKTNATAAILENNKCALKNTTRNNKQMEPSRERLNLTKRRSTESTIKSTKLNTTNIIANVTSKENIDKEEKNSLEVLAQMNSFLMKVKAEKLSSKRQHSKAQWEQYDKRFNLLIEDLKTIYKNLKPLT